MNKKEKEWQRYESEEKWWVPLREKTGVTEEGMLSLGLEYSK